MRWSEFTREVMENVFELTGLGWQGVVSYVLLRVYISLNFQSAGFCTSFGLDRADARITRGDAVAFVDHPVLGNVAAQSCWDLAVSQAVVQWVADCKACVVFTGDEVGFLLERANRGTLCRVEFRERLWSFKCRASYAS